MKRPLVMFVSPNPDSRKRFFDTAMEHFQRQINVITAESGEEGILAYEKLFGTGFHFAVAITEEELSGMSGVDFLVKVCQDFPEARTVLLALTNDMENMRRAKNSANLYRYIPTPWDIHQLISATAQALRSYLRFIELMDYTDLLQDLNQSVQEISSELNLEKLQDVFLQHLLQNTEADRTFYLARNGDRYFAVAGRDRDEKAQKALATEIKDNAVAVTRSVQDRIERARALPNGCSYRMWAPVIQNGTEVALLYAELNDPEDFFSDAQRECIVMMASQLAISLENVRLYQRMEEQQAELSKNNALLSEKVEDIFASMRYAQRIQEAMRPNTGLIGAFLPEFFILYQNKSLVSGDFYWFAERNGNFLFAVASCEGKGVPGAFLSIITTNFLNQAVNEFGITEPSAILELVDHRLRTSLKQDESAEDMPDSVQMAVLLYEMESQTVVFAGAQRNLVMIREDQLLVAEGNTRFLGGNAQTAPDNVFRAKQLSVQAGDQFYMYTDGIENQPNAENNPNITFGGYQLKDVLFANRKLPMKAQQEKLQDALYEWRDGQPHTDDILLAGLRF